MPTRLMGAMYREPDELPREHSFQQELLLLALIVQSQMQSLALREGTDYC